MTPPGQPSASYGYPEMNRSTSGNSSSGGVSAAAGSIYPPSTTTPTASYDGQRQLPLTMHTHTGSVGGGGHSVSGSHAMMAARQHPIKHPPSRYQLPTTTVQPPTGESYSMGRSGASQISGGMSSQRPLSSISQQRSMTPTVGGGGSSSMRYSSHRPMTPGPQHYQQYQPQQQPILRQPQSQQHQRVTNLPNPIMPLQRVSSATAAPGSGVSLSQTMNEPMDYDSYDLPFQQSQPVGYGGGYRMRTSSGGMGRQSSYAPRAIQSTTPATAGKKHARESPIYEQVTKAQRTSLVGSTRVSTMNQPLAGEEEQHFIEPDQPMEEQPQEQLVQEEEISSGVMQTDEEVVQQIEGAGGVLLDENGQPVEGEMETAVTEQSEGQIVTEEEAAPATEESKEFVYIDIAATIGGDVDQLVTTSIHSIPIELAPVTEIKEIDEEMTTVTESETTNQIDSTISLPPTTVVHEMSEEVQFAPELTAIASKDGLVEIEDGKLSQVEEGPTSKAIQLTDVNDSVNALPNQRIEEPTTPTLLLMPNVSDSSEVEEKKESVTATDSLSEKESQQQPTNETIIPQTSPTPNSIAVPTAPVQHPPLPLIRDDEDEQLQLMEDAIESEKKVEFHPTLRTTQIFGASDLLDVSGDQVGISGTNGGVSEDRTPSEILFGDSISTVNSTAAMNGFTRASTLLATNHQPATTTLDVPINRESVTSSLATFPLPPRTNGQEGLLFELHQLFKRHYQHEGDVGSLVDGSTGDGNDLRLLKAQQDLKLSENELSRMRVENASQQREIHNLTNRIRSIQSDARRQLEAKERLLQAKDKQLQEVTHLRDLVSDDTEAWNDIQNIAELRLMTRL